MQVYLTRNAHTNLATIFDYHVDYRLLYANKFYDEIVDFIFSMLSSHPEIGVLYNDTKSLRKLVYNKRYNIYYTIKDDIVHVLYIIDGKLYLNVELLEADVELRPLA